MKLGSQATLLGFAAIMATGIVGLVLAVGTLSGSSGSITVTGPPALTIVSATVGNTACGHTSSSFTCPSTSLQQGVSETISVTVSNPAAVLAQSVPTPTYGYSSCAGCPTSSILSTVAYGSFPYSIPAGGQATFQFTITATATGSDTVTITL